MQGVEASGSSLYHCPGSGLEPLVMGKVASSIGEDLGVVPFGWWSVGGIIMVVAFMKKFMPCAELCRNLGDSILGQLLA